MDSLNQIEIQNIRHIHGMSTNACNKIIYYKTITSDQKVIHLFDKISSALTSFKTELSDLL